MSPPAAKRQKTHLKNAELQPLYIRVQTALKEGCLNRLCRGKNILKHVRKPSRLFGCWSKRLLVKHFKMSKKYKKECLKQLFFHLFCKTVKTAFKGLKSLMKETRSDCWKIINKESLHYRCRFCRTKPVIQNCVTFETCINCFYSVNTYTNVVPGVLTRLANCETEI